MARDIQFLYFDLGKVLLDFDHQLACSQLAELMGSTPEVVFEEVFQSGQQVRYETGQLSTGEFHEWLCGHFGSHVPVEDVAYAVSHIFTPITDSISIAEELARAGYRMGILSNTCDCHWEYCWNKPYEFLSQCFTIHALSFRLKSMKPGVDIYRDAALLAETHPSKIFFVDDRADNVAGAQSAGFDAVQFTSPSQLRRDLQVRGLLA